MRTRRLEAFTDGVIAIIRGWFGRSISRTADGLANIRLPDAALERVYLLHPNPWPKARHAKRRMINHDPPPPSSSPAASSGSAPTIRPIAAGRR